PVKRIFGYFFCNRKKSLACKRAARGETAFDFGCRAGLNRNSNFSNGLPRGSASPREIQLFAFRPSSRLCAFARAGLHFE
ncbi:MAG: hypothetical protein WDZ60_02120, partial [Wenzhouxiangellaceae bacterium]